MSSARVPSFPCAGTRLGRRANPQCPTLSRVFPSPLRAASCLTRGTLPPERRVTAGRVVEGSRFDLSTALPRHR